MNQKSQSINKIQFKDEIVNEQSGIACQRGKYIDKGVLAVGIDIGRNIHEQIGTTIEGGYTSSYKFSNSRRGVEKAEEMIQKWKKQFGKDRVVIGYESTGNYWRPLIYYLQDKGYETQEVSAVHTKKMREMYDNSPLKTDEKSAMIIADLIKQGKRLHAITPRAEMMTLRQFVKVYRDLTKEYVSVCNRITAIQDITFPERHTIIKSIDNVTSLYLFNTAAFPPDIEAKGLKWLEKQMKMKSKGKYTALAASKLYTLNQETIGLKEGLEGFRYELKLLLKRLNDINEQIEEVKEQISIMIQNNEDSKYLKSIKGIGDTIAAAIIAETGGLENFNSSAELIKFAGLSLYEVSSGDHKGTKRITRRGRSSLRHMIYFAAMQQTRKGMPLYDFYRELVDRNVCKIKAIIAVARKLLRIIFSLVKNKQYYDCNYDKNKRKA